MGDLIWVLLASKSCDVVHRQELSKLPMLPKTFSSTATSTPPAHRRPPRKPTYDPPMILRATVQYLQ